MSPIGLAKILLGEGGFPLFAETTRSQLASIRLFAERFPVIV